MNHAPLSHSPEEGSRTLLHAAIGGEGDELQGRYLSGCEVLEESNYLFTPEGRLFWETLGEDSNHAVAHDTNLHT